MDGVTTIWNFLLVHPVLSLMVGAYNLTRDFGIAIVAATIVIRLLLYPLFVTQIRSQRVMQEIAPAMAELKAKYGKDRQRITQEQMKLYKERGYNPAMGCLPLIVQMPILFAMYAAFIQAPELTGNTLSGILPPFISNPLGPNERLDLTANWLPWLQGLGNSDPLFILPILAGATQLISSIMAMPAAQPKAVDPQARMMQSMAYYFPLITVVIAWQLPAGLSLYWVATTVFQIVQQYLVTGWGRLVRWVPFLAYVPSPADATLRRRQQAAIVEAEKDMKVVAVPEGPGAQRAGSKREGNRNRRRKNR